jgi:hypothetical protein
LSGLTVVGSSPVKRRREEAVGSSVHAGEPGQLRHPCLPGDRQQPGGQLGGQPDEVGDDEDRETVRVRELGAVVHVVAPSFG